MKKILTMILALAVVMSMAIPAFAYDGTVTTNTSSWSSWCDWWNNYIPADPTDPTVPSEPEVEIGVPAITESRFYHTGVTSSLKNQLQIKWDAVDGADSYEIEVVKADGPVLTYTSSTNSLMVKNMACPKVYIESASTWTAATVQVRAIAGDAVGAWNATAKIGCDAIH